MSSNSIQKIFHCDILGRGPEHFWLLLQNKNHFENKDENKLWGSGRQRLWEFWNNDLFKGKHETYRFLKGMQVARRLSCQSFEWRSSFDEKGQI